MVHGWWRKPSSRSPCWRLQKTCCFDGLPLRWRDSGDWWFSERLNDFHEQVCASAQQHPWRCPPLRHWLDMLFNILFEFHFILLYTYWKLRCYFDVFFIIIFCIHTYIPVYLISLCFPFPTILQWNSNRIPETSVGYWNAGLHSPLQVFHAKFDWRM